MIITLLRYAVIIGLQIPVLYNVYNQQIGLIDVLWIFFADVLILTLLKSVWVERAHRQLYPSSYSNRPPQTIRQVITAVISYAAAAYFLYQFTVIQQLDTVAASALSAESFVTWIGTGFWRLLTGNIWMTLLILIGQIGWMWYELKQTTAQKDGNELFLQLTSNQLTLISLPLAVLVVNYIAMIAGAGVGPWIGLIVLGVKLLIELIAEYNPYRRYLQPSTQSKV